MASDQSNTGFIWAGMVCFILASCGEERATKPADTQAQTVQDLDRIIQQNGDRDGSLGQLRQAIQAQKPMNNSIGSAKPAAKPDEFVVGQTAQPHTLHDPGFIAPVEQNSWSGHSTRRRD